jgi:Sulfotransferase family
MSTALPTFFIIGAPKAGTTSLHYYLDQHPQIQMSSVKEPRFFAVPERHLPLPPATIDCRTSYERLFDSRFPVRGESSTDYTVHPRCSNVPERIKALVPQAKFVYLVRDPIDRAISHYKMRAALMGERRSLSEAIGQLSDLYSPYISPGLYAFQLEEYLRTFPDERLLVIDHADLLVSRAATLRRVFAFLSVDTSLESEGFNEERLTSRDWRAYPSGYANLVARYIAPGFRWIPPSVRRSVRRAIEDRLWPPIDTTLEESLRVRLEQLYAPDVARLRRLTGQKFSSWCV